MNVKCIKSSRKNLFAFLCAFSTAACCLYLPNTSDQDKQRVVDNPAFHQIQPYDVVLSSYMSGGSTLTGIILGWRTDTFYVYEPFWKLSPWAYWHGFSALCRSDRLECRTVEPGEQTNDTKTFGKRSCSLRTAQKMLVDIYNCKFHKFAKSAYIPDLTDSAGGPSWRMIKNCGGRKSRKKCIHDSLPNICKKASHRVAKVLRFSVDILEVLLSERQNIKIIHLLRDPRAIINSRMKTSWYEEQTKDIYIINNAKVLCKKISYDFKAGKILMEKFPDRFRFVYYEDLTENPFKKTEALYKYLGMDLDEQKFPQLNNLSVFSDERNRTLRQKNTAFWWRKTLEWKTVQNIDTVCADVYHELGYISITNSNDMGNMSFKSVVIPEQYKL